ncbi:MAG: hypothetical protein WCR71_04180 [Bacteroidales bacterium]
MRLIVKASLVFLAIFVLAGLIFAGTQSQDPFLGILMGALGVVNGFVLLKDIRK